MKTKRIPLTVLALTPEEQKECEELRRQEWKEFRDRFHFPTFESQQPYWDLEQGKSVTLNTRDVLLVCLVFCGTWFGLVLAMGGF